MEHSGLPSAVRNSYVATGRRPDAMHRRRYMALAGSGLAGVLAGCLRIGVDEERPEPTVRELRVPEPALPEHDQLHPEPIPDDEASVSEPVRNRGGAGHVHVTLTPLEPSEGSGDGVATGVTARASNVTLAANETRTVAFEDVPADDAERYVVQAFPASATAVVHNEGPSGRVVVELTSADGERVHDRRTIELGSEATREVTFTGTPVQLSDGDLDARAEPAESGWG